MGLELLAYIGVGVGSAVLAIGAYQIALSHKIKQRLVKAELDVKRMISDAEIEAKKIVENGGIALNKTRNSLENREKDIERNALLLEKQSIELQEKTLSVQKLETELKDQQETLKSSQKTYQEKLSSINDVSPDALKFELISELTQNYEEELKAKQRQLREQTDNEVEAEARDILLSAMQRISTNPAVDATATIVDLPSEDMKGRIIGREGRNIRSFEAVTGTTLMIDETPDSVLISAFDPVKREISRIALESLLKDGRIHPSTIEVAYEQAKEEVQKNVQLLGEQAMSTLKLKPSHPEILKLLGKLHFRLSLNQNSLEHSIEVAFIASMLASELGLDPILAKRAALFHDIGKAIDHEFEGSHALIAGKMIARYNEDPIVVNAVSASHEEVEAESPYAPLIVIADRISAMRPGARCDSLDSYVDRVRSLEDIAKGFEGVKEAFALQAGREIRVIVEPSQLSDEEARELARNVSREIEDTMNYPSTIKITVIREQRFCETAK